MDNAFVSPAAALGPGALCLQTDGERCVTRPKWIIEILLISWHFRLQLLQHFLYSWEIAKINIHWHEKDQIHTNIHNSQINISLEGLKKMSRKDICKICIQATGTADRDSNRLPLTCHVTLNTHTHTHGHTWPCTFRPSDWGDFKGSCGIPDLKQHWGVGVDVHVCVCLWVVWAQSENGICQLKHT